MELLAHVGLAVEAPASAPPWDAFAQYSVLGATVIALAWFAARLVNQMWAREKEILAREVARGDRLEEENRALNLAMQDKAIPTLLAAANAISGCTELIRDQQQRERDALRRRDGER